MTGILHIVVARKPIEGTVAENCLTFGCGAINIDECRIGTEQGDWKGKGGGGVHEHWQGTDLHNKIYGGDRKNVLIDHTKGRFPANLVHDGSEGAIAGFPQNAGAFAKASGPTRGLMGTQGRFGSANGDMGESCFYGDSGSASRFFFSFNEQESDE